jgi:uncharacterized protein (TIGR01244 family)
VQQDYLQICVLELAPQVFVTGPLSATELELAAKQGFRSIVNNRDDGESAGQPASADLAGAAEAVGMAFVQFPVDPRSISAEDVVAFRKTVTSSSVRCSCSVAPAGARQRSGRWPNRISRRFRRRP